MPLKMLFTAFEPSGDQLGAGLFQTLRKHMPDVEGFGFGGPKMAQAGIELIEQTTDHAAMFTDVLSLIRIFRKRRARLAEILKTRDVDLHVPVDSPAGNWPFCKLIRRMKPDAKIIHLAAPQVWAWASWRVGKLRRLTDHVLCLLPFEPDWFADKDVPATFVGHPMFDRPPLTDGQAVTCAGKFPTDAVKLALLPGSRNAEVDRNWPMMLEVARRLSAIEPRLVATIGARDETLASRIANLTAEHSADQSSAASPQIETSIGQFEETLAWADMALVVSGTATLQVASYRLPMAAVFNTSRFKWQVAGRFIVSIRTFTLPNLISEWQGDGRAIVELAPHFGAVQPVVDALSPLLDPDQREKAGQRLDAVCAPLRATRFEDAAAAAVLKVIGSEKR